jgi:hypothetical protein
MVSSNTPFLLGQSTMRRTWGLVFLVGCAGLLAHRSAIAQSGNQGAGIAAGVEYLRNSSNGVQSGEAGLAALALIKADVPASDPTLVALLAKARERISGTSYTPGRDGGPDIYEAAVIGMAFANVEPAGRKVEVEAVAKFLASRQKSNGAWDYSNRTAGDASISQYALLGLWEAENTGITVQAKVWDLAAQWFLSVQRSSGGWKYHPDENEWGETISMTAAGVGSLLLCKRQLARFRKEGGADATSPYLVPLVAEGTAVPQQHYDVKTTNGAIDVAVKRGIGWLNSHFSGSDRTVVGPTLSYSMYGIERVGALAERDTLGGVDWYERGLARVLAAQGKDGSWSGDFGSTPNTAWAVLYMTRATAKTVKKFEIKRLKGGTLLGGRLLPDNIENLTIAQGRVVVRPMNGAVEQMLSVLADPRALNADAALAGLIDKYRTDGPKALRPYKDRLRKLLEDRDSGVRRVACWGLGRTGDLDVAPDLIEVLRREQDPAIVGEARIGLHVLARKIEGYGPPPDATVEQRQESAKQWRAWYDAVRPPDRTQADEESSK